MKSSSDNNSTIHKKHRRKSDNFFVTHFMSASNVLPKDEQRSELNILGDKCPIEFEEDIIYFQYNSDGEAQWDDFKSDMNSFV